MNRTILIAAIALLASTAAAAQAERDPDKMAAIAATIVIFDSECENVSAKIGQTAEVIVEMVGKPKVIAAMTQIGEQIKTDGKDAWCAVARKAFPLLVEPEKR
jgi:hypothetical protein